ncbi:N-acetylmuramoyl-L-alanine amidase [Spongiimicrobium sp. 3-5]|uniref:N-acetylmuramoyl-L-alanine amidase family protein n=1 Tax=Spongiimicrobium sp. 3-5 TaxID=3332596 RepID=UPI0039810CB6
MKMKLFYIIPVFILTCLLISFSKNDTENGPADKFIVVLDAGHGGHDPGNLGNGYLEKNIALSIVLRAGELLAKNQDIEVIYTRKDDTFIDLFVRGEIANKANADLFVSVHCDSHTSDAHGAGTFVLGLHANKQNFEIAKKENSVIYLEDNYEIRYAEYDINSPESVIGLTIMQEEFLDQSIMLAKMMQDNFSNKLKRNNRKVKQAGFIVLHQTFMPSVLIETGFLTNKDEGQYLNSKTGQSQMGKAIADAIVEYKNNIKSNTTSASPRNVPEPATTESKPAETKPIVETPKEVVVATTESKKPVLEQPSEEAKEDTAKEAVARKEEKPEPLKEVATKPKPKPPVAVVEKPKPKASVEAVTTKTAEEEPAAKTNKPAVATGTQKTTNIKDDIVFKVQILASSKDLPLRAEDFRGLNRLSKEPYKNLYRYMYGSVKTHFEATLLKSNADAKGYTSSYIVAYRQGKRIELSEALKYVSE